MKVNLHTHTFRCGHASGTEREYIENAISAGFTTLGFSDHAPYPFRGGYYSGFRMHIEAQEDYVHTLLALREEYKDQIDIKIGYEAEYYPALFSDFLALITRFPVDYLILGQHFICNETDGCYSGNATDDEAVLRQYVDQTCDAMRTGLFTCFAHPDLLHFTGDPDCYDEHASRLIRCAKECRVPLEINLLGIRGKRHYPRERFFELAGEIGAEVCIGYDAHGAADMLDPSYSAALEMAERYHLPVNFAPELRKVRGTL